MTKRVEVLFEPDEYEALRREAEQRDESVGELIRLAVRRHYLVASEERRRKAVEFLTSGPPIDVGTWEEAKKLIGRWTDEEIEKLFP